MSHLHPLEFFANNLNDSLNPGCCCAATIESNRAILCRFINWIKALVANC